MPLSPAARCITLSASSAALPLRFAVRHKMLEVTEPIFGHVGGSSIDEGSSDVVVDGDVCVTTRVVAMLISRGS
jgi:hypothetical protein